MIVYQKFIRDDGEKMVMAFSDADMMIERDGIKYAEAVDLESQGREYVETDVPIPREVSESDKDAALRCFGVEV